MNENNAQPVEMQPVAQKPSVMKAIWSHVKTPLKYTAAVCVGIGAGIGGHKLATKKTQTPTPEVAPAADPV